MNIAVLVSGGVDSSVALQLLQAQGHQVTAFYLKIWLEDELSYLADCPWAEDISYVTAVCQKLNVPLEVLSLQKEYHQYVVSVTIDSIKAGNTPNPDILCNSLIKFGFFINQVGHRFDKIASGHYAQLEAQADGSVRLIMAPDAIKDQTYFLSQLTQAQLQKLLFPIGHLHKAQVRELAHTYDLPNKDRKDSQGICFLGKFKFRDFVRAYAGTKVGPLIEHETGVTVGTHEGFWFYTIGQRQGIGLGGGPWYVVRKDPEQNTVFISKNYYAADKPRDTLTVRAVNWIEAHRELPTSCTVKLRHGPHVHACQLLSLGDGRLQVQLATSDQGIASGQFAAFYEGEICLGGGVIE